WRRGYVRYVEHGFLTAPDLKRIGLEFEAIAFGLKCVSARPKRNRLAQVFNRDVVAVDRDLHPRVGARDLDGTVVGRDVDDYAEQGGRGHEAGGEFEPESAVPGPLTPHSGRLRLSRSERAIRCGPPLTDQSHSGGWLVRLILLARLGC